MRYCGCNDNEGKSACGCDNITYGGMQYSLDDESTAVNTGINITEELTNTVLFTRLVYLEKRVDNLAEATSTLLSVVQEITNTFRELVELIDNEENHGPKHGGRIEYKDKFTGEHLPDDLDKGGYD